MKIPTHDFRNLFVATAAASLFLGACSTAPIKPEGADAVRGKLTQLQSDPRLASRAPVAIKEAELAVAAAEQPRQDKDLEKHLVFMADHKVDIASAQAQARLLEDQRKSLGEQRESARLDSRTREADIARSDANYARSEADMARSDANSARDDADVARGEAAAALMTAEAVQQQSEDLKRQIAASQQSHGSWLCCDAGRCAVCNR